LNTKDAKPEEREGGRRGERGRKKQKRKKKLVVCGVVVHVKARTMCKGTEGYTVCTGSVRMHTATA